MEKKYEKKPKYTSQEGVFKFPNLTKPSTKFNAAGVYDVTLRLNAADAKAFEAKHAADLRAANEAGLQEYEKLSEKTKNKIKFSPAEMIGTPVFDEETKKPTGDVEFKFKRTATGVSKKDGKPWSVKVPVFDSKGKPIVGTDIWGGSRGKVSYEVYGYFIPGTGQAGLSMKLLAAQVIELVTKGSASADLYGFDKEDGYEVEDTAAADTPAEEVADTETDF